MATVVDSLKIVLTLDDSDFKKKRADAQEGLDRTKKQMTSSLKGIDEGVKKTFEGFASLTRAAVGFFAVLVGARGMKEFIEQTTQMNVALGNFSNLVDVGPQRINAWGLAVRALGGDAQSAQAAFLGLNRTFQQWRTSGEISREQLRIAARAGVTLSPWDSNETQMAKMAQILQNLRKNPKEGKGAATYAAGLFGITDPGAIDLLERPDYQSRVKEMEKYSPTQHEIELSQQLLESWTKLSAAAVKFGQDIFEKVEPHVNAVLNAVREILEDLDKLLPQLTTDVPHKIGRGVVRTWRRAHHRPDADYTGGANPDFGHGAGLTRPHVKQQVELTTGGAPVSSTNPLHVVQDTPEAAPFSAWDNFVGSLGRGLGGIARGVGSIFGGGGGGTANPADLPTGAASGAAGDRIKTAMAAAMDQLRKEGVPEGQLQKSAAMLVGNAIGESELNPRQSHDSGTGYGIYGARLGRRDRMLAWLKANNYPADSLEGQARYMAHEAMTDETYAPTRAALMGGATLQEGTVTTRWNFESPGVPRDAERIAGALRAYNTGPGELSHPMTDQERLKARVDSYNKYMYWLRHKGDQSMNMNDVSRQSMLASGSVSGGRTTNIHVGDVTIHSGATNSEDLARDFHKHLANTELAAMGNYGGV